MTSIKTLALAAAAVAGLGMFASTDAEARGFGGRGGGFHGGGFRAGGFHGGGHRHIGGLRLGGHRHIGHRHGGYWRGGRWWPYAVGVGVIGTGAVIAASCYRVRWVDTPYGLVRQRVNICD
ncbi:hypothetical protein E8L99_14995 [Phreatobacter aquaticus]|uniref:Sulfur globule protein n=1 Tax=Phreatobacter aquaticus TaxID=2570229 RepID=A0A4D7QK20_9HYPH|nr:hypothetical protein [Phreatobacter aquaticus]QCK86971.1 hypothetical protein E8L99_14995 [Phreatobacter aquaticus]